MKLMKYGFLMTSKLLMFIAALMISLSSFACQGITKSGAKCKRAEEPYCYLHAGQASSYTGSSASKTSTTTSRKYTGKSYDVYQERKTSNARFFSKAMRQKKFDEQQGMCAYCGKKCGSISEMHGDHIVPFSKGGQTVYSNLQMLCPTCNLKKSDK